MMAEHCEEITGELVNSAKKDIAIAGLSPAEVALQALSMGYGKEALEVLQGISELQLRHDAENAKRAFAAAMAKCQAEMPIVPEKAKNQQTGNSPYAKLKDVVKIAKPVYTKHGFSISFYEEDSPKENHIRWCADVMHADGHSIPRHVDVPIDDKGIKGTVNKTPTHAMKSSSTYGRGILICHIFNIPTGEDLDDDGNAAGGKAFINEAQQSEMEKLILRAYGKDQDAISKFFDYIGCSGVNDIPISDFQKHKAALEAIAAKRVK
jgi:hypothetical protein